MKVRWMVIAVALCVMPFNANAAGDPGFATGSCKLGNNTVPGSTGTIVVDQSGPIKTIGAAVAAASPGNHIKVRAGVYNETVTVPNNKPGLRITGEDRNTTIIDGRTGSSFFKVGIQVFADRVVVENMTGRYFSDHAFVWGERGKGGTGYWGRYLTAYNNGDYGIFAFDYRCGQFDNSYAWGNADAGFYIGNCFPCDTVITNVVAENNALGYSGTNAGMVTIRDSYWHNNAMGIVPSSLDSEDKPPQRGLIVQNNIIDDNNNKTAPGAGLAGTFWGVGIALPGVQNDFITGNKITDHHIAGIVIAPLPDSNIWLSSGNVIWGNEVTHDANLHPDSFDLGQGTSSGPNNCWQQNTFGNSAPEMIETIWACADPTIGRPVTPPGGDPRAEIGLALGVMGEGCRSQDGGDICALMSERNPSPWQTYIEPTLDKAPMPSGATVVPWLPALGVD